MTVENHLYTRPMYSVRCPAVPGATAIGIKGLPAFFFFFLQDHLAFYLFGFTVLLRYHWHPVNSTEFIDLSVKLSVKCTLWWV